MSDNVMVKRIFKSNHVVNGLLIVFAILVAMAFFSYARTASAAGSEQISGVGYFDEMGTCDDPITNADGQSPDFALIMTGDLEGCLYTFVETFECHPSGTYKETGNEIFVGNGSPGNDGTFSTTYIFTAKFEDCPNLGIEIVGRCQHPIAADSGTEDFKGVRGRIHFKDDVVTGDFPYTGHLQFK